jgi:hypothetical protein
LEVDTSSIGARGMKMVNKKKGDKKPCLYFDWDARAENFIEDLPRDSLTKAELDVLSDIFSKHPSLVKISAPFRDPESKGLLSET